MEFEIVEVQVARRKHLYRLFETYRESHSIDLQTFFSIQFLGLEEVDEQIVQNNSGEFPEEPEVRTRRFIERYAHFTPLLVVS